MISWWLHSEVSKQIRLWCTCMKQSGAPASNTEHVDVVGSVNTIRLPRTDVVGSVNTIRLRRYGWNTSTEGSLRRKKGEEKEKESKHCLVCLRDVLGSMNGKFEGVYVKYPSLIVSCHWIKVFITA